MEGIRLRSDSTGSTKSAFYQGTIVSASNTAGDYIDIENASNKQRKSKRNSGYRGKERKPFQAYRKLTVQDVANIPADSLVRSHLESASNDVSTLVPGGYNHRSPRFRSKSSSATKGFTPMQTSSYSNARSTTEDPSVRVYDGIADAGIGLQPDLHRDYLRHSNATQMTTECQSGLLGTALLEESPSADDAELRGVSLDIDLSPPSSPTTLVSCISEGERFPTQINHSSAFSDSYFQRHSPPGPLVASSHPFQHLTNQHRPNSTYGTHIPPTPSLQSEISGPPVTSIDHRQPRIDSRNVGPYFITSVQEDDESSNGDREDLLSSFCGRLMNSIDPSLWLAADVKRDEDGNPYFDDKSDWSLAGVVRTILYNPIYPEFTSLQQFVWAVILGIAMGVFTAMWKILIELCVDVVWKVIPGMLLSWGVFTDLDGMFPLYHYMWITPTLFGGFLSYVFAALPTKIPGQNDWIHSLHSRGVQDPDTFGLLFVLSTAGMASGLSLGPELPLILTSGMIGSWLGVLCKQSILSARVLNLTAASAAIGGFFGFPMAGALFVLELPHRMGLQYFEALSPATIASIVAVLTNRLVTGNDVTGYYEYPFLNESLPSSIFHDAIVFGLFGGALGIVYTKAVIILKNYAHDILHMSTEKDEAENILDCDPLPHAQNTNETSPLVGNIDPDESKMKTAQTKTFSRKPLSLAISHEPTRAGVVGSLIGFIVGVVCIFIPHVMFWGESQLQNLIDKGRTPLPIFGRGNETSADLVALGFCMLDDGTESSSQAGFSLGCSAAITIAKIFVTGLSLGTGIVGGHFWAPLFVGCAASHFLTDFVDIISNSIGVSLSLSNYPCVALLCIMGSCHVVTFRAHIAIILILTLTIDAFDPENGVAGALKVAGDYSAVFPLLTVAVFVALQISRHSIFYEKQRSRGDIMALPEVLCEPGKEGRPLVMDYDGNLHELDESDYEYESDTEEEAFESHTNYRTIDGGATQHDIEAQFEACSFSPTPNGSTARVPSPLPPRPKELPPLQGAKKERRRPSKILDDVFNGTMVPIGNGSNCGTIDRSKGRSKSHRRTQSDPLDEQEMRTRSDALWGAIAPTRDRRDSSSGMSTGKIPSPVALKRVSSFGEIDQEQPSLLDQARRRAASSASAETRKAQQRNGGVPWKSTNRV